MCVAMAASGDDYRFVATDLGFNAYDGGRRVHSGISEDRLRWLGSGWGVGSGDARAVHWSLSEIEDPSDEQATREIIQRCAERAQGFPHDDDQLWNCTNILTADPGGVSQYRTDGRNELGGDRHYFLLTPPDVPMEKAEQLNRDFERSLDPTDVRCAVPAAQAVLRWVAECSDVTASEYAIGLLTPSDAGNGTWDRIRI